MNDPEIPYDSPANWLQPGDFQVWCPRVYSPPGRCGFMAPVNAVSGMTEMGCERCGAELRVAEVSRDGARTDKPIPLKRAVLSRQGASHE